MIQHKEKHKTNTKIVIYFVKKERIAKINAQSSKTDKDSTHFTVIAKGLKKSANLFFLLKLCCYYHKIDVYRDMSCYLMISSVPGLDIHIYSPQQYSHTCDCSRHSLSQNTR